MPLSLRRLPWALILLCGALAPAAGAASEPLETQFRSVDVPQSTSPAVAQDRAGFLWVATSRGLARYDGYRLRPIEQSGATSGQRTLGWVRALAPGRDGRMWIGTEFLGLLVFDPQQDKVESFGSHLGPTGAHAPIRALAEDAGGDLWVGTLGEGLFQFSPRTRRFEPQDLRWQGQPEPRVLALRITRDGSIWAGHWRGLAVRHPARDGQPARWDTVPLPDQPRFPQGTAVMSLAETRDGRLWLGTQDGQLGVVEQGRVRWVQHLQVPVQALAEDDLGRLWAGTKRGLLWVDTASGAILARLRHDPRRPTSLAGNDISSLLRDQSGAMWVTGYGLGLQRHLHHPALAVRGPDEDAASPLAEADVRALLTLRNGEVLAPTQQGTLVRLDGRPGQQLRTLGLWPRERRSTVESLAEAPDGSLWMAGGGRLEHRAADGRLLRDWPLDGGRAQQLLLRPGGEVWLGMQEGLYRLPGPQADALQRLTLADGTPLHGGIYALAEDAASGRLWVGGQRGLYREAPGRGGLALLPQAPDETLGSPIVMALLQARDGTLWVDTTNSGLHRLVGWDGQGRARFERIGERLGMEGVYGGNLREDTQGRIWSQLHVYDPRSGQVDSFGPAEGAGFGSFWFFASTTLPDGSLLFGGSRGLLRVQPQAYATRSAGMPLVISGLRVNGQPASPQGLEQGRGQGLQLPAGTRTLGVEFAGLDYADPGRLRYQYRLQGLESEWTSADASARNPSFGPLKPGRYVLQVRAMLPLAGGAPAQLELPVELRPEWWQTVWAQAAGAALALLSVWGWVSWRTRLLRRREAELQALVDVRTAELREASLTDALTGLRNRRYLSLRLPDDLRLCLRRFEGGDGPGHPAPAPGPDSDLVLMLLDLDHFKRVNDVHGHAAGDAVLVQLAQRLRQVFRETDSLVRWGGEEVLVLVRDTSREGAAELAGRACAAMREQPFEIGEGRSLPVTVSLGFCAFPLDPVHPRAWDWQDCLGLADSALYAAKARGRDGFVGAVQARGLMPAQAPVSVAQWVNETRLVVALDGPADRRGPAAG